MSDVLDYVREKDPRFKDVSDDDLTLFIGSKKPDFLQDPGFKEDFQKAAATKSLNLALKGTGEVLKVLNNPAVGEASQMGQEQAQAGRLQAGMDLATQATSKVISLIDRGAMAAPSAEELASKKASDKQREDISKMGPSAALAAVRHAQTKQAGEGVGVLTEPLAEIVPKITGDQLERILGIIATGMPAAINKEREAGATPIDDQVPGYGPNAFKTDFKPEAMLSPEARNLVRGVAGVEQSLADQANFFASPLGISTLGMGSLPAPIAKLVGIAFTAQMASQIPGHSEAVSTELNKPEGERDYEKIAKTVTDAAGAMGFTVAGGLHLFEPVIRAARARSAYRQALREAFPVAPATASALSTQVGSDYMTGGPLAPPTRLPEGDEPPGKASETTPKPKGTQSSAAVKLQGLGWTAEQIGALTPEARIQAAAENRPAPAAESIVSPVKPTETPTTEKGASDAGTKAQEQAAGALPAEQGKPVEPKAKGEAEKGTPLGQGEDKGLTPKPEVANLEKGKSLNKLGDPLGTTYHATAEDWARWQELSKQREALVKAKKFDDVFQIQKEMEGIKNKYGGMPPAEPKAAEELSQPPKQPNVDDFKGAANIIKAFSKAHDEWKGKVIEWLKQFPENKALIFGTENHTYAVTKDPKGGWRYTSFSNQDHMPIGHSEFDSREKAVTELLRSNKYARVLDKMPFQVEPLPIPESAQKYRIGTNPQTYTLVERLEQNAAEKANNEQPVRVRNENTGKEEIVMEGDLTPVKTRTAAEKEKGKAGKRDLDKELRDLGLDPSVFSSKAEKQAAIIRENQKKQGPGTPHITQPADPKAQIEQLEESFRNIRGRRVPLGERVRAMFDMGKKLAAAKDIVTEAIAGLKTTGDYLIDKWAGYNDLDDMIRAKGELSAEIEKNGWRMKHFVKTILDNVQDVNERAAIAKWVGAGGDMEKLIAGYEEAPARFKQHYLDAMDLSGDLLVGAMNIRNYFDSRLQEAIDAGVLKDGVEDYIHRIYERTPDLERKMTAYLQTGLLKTNPALAKKRIFDHDWEAERLGYNVVQDFLPRIVEYEAALTRAIAARKFVRKISGFKDENGNRVPGMLAADGRPVVDIAGLGIPVDDAEGIREASLIDPSYKARAKAVTELDPETGEPTTTENPLTDRSDYQARNQYAVFRNWKWVLNDGAGNPIYAKGDLIIHPNFVSRFDKLLEPSRIRYAQSPILRTLGRGALGVGGFVKQSMLDLSGFHQVQMAVHGTEHRVYTLPGQVPAGLKALGFEKMMQDIDLNDPVMDGLLKGGMTLGGDYHYASEGLQGRSITRLIPGINEVTQTYHQWLFQDFIPRLKATMGKSAFERNMKAYASDLASGRRTVDDIYHMTANQANAAFGELNQITLERSKTMQDALRLIFLAPDFLEARGRFALQALRKGGGDPRTLDYWKKGGPITNNEQRMALAFGAMGLWGFARIANLMINGQMHNEPENLFSVVYKGRSYGLRTVQGDILHLMTHPVQFWMSRLNPLFGRTLLEAASGRDYFGRKRSPLEQLWDMVSTVEPASIRHSREHTIWESLLNAGGVTSRRFSDVDDAFKLAQKWKDKHGVGMKGEFIYDPNKDPLRPLKLALSNGDEGGSVKEIQNLIKKKTYTLPKLDEYWDRYSAMPFAGSQANDKKFIQTLSEDQKKTVTAAAQHKKAMLKLYRQAKGKYLDAVHGPAPKESEDDADQPTPQVQ